MSEKIICQYLFISEGKIKCEIDYNSIDKTLKQETAINTCISDPYHCPKIIDAKRKQYEENELFIESAIRRNEELKKELEALK